MKNMMSMLVAAGLIVLPVAAAAQQQTPNDPVDRPWAEPQRPGYPGSPQPGSSGQGRQPAPAVAAQDRTFLQKATAGNAAEVELAELAQDKATSDAVKNYAQMLERDHSAVLDELEQIASRKNVDVEAEPAAEHKQVKEKLDNLEGVAFDRAFVETMVANHRKGIADFETASKSSDAEVKAFASKTLPKLREHLKQAEALAPGR